MEKLLNGMKNVGKSMFGLTAIVVGGCFCFKIIAWSVKSTFFKNKEQ